MIPDGAPARFLCDPVAATPALCERSTLASRKHKLWAETQPST